VTAAAARGARAALAAAALAALPAALPAQAAGAVLAGMAAGTVPAAVPAAVRAPEGDGRVVLRASALPASALAVRAGGRWRGWWRSERAPARWTAADAAVAGAVRWRAAAPGVERAALLLGGTGEAWRTEVVLVRVDPRRCALRLHALVGADGRARAWRAADAPPEAAVALNAGQFTAGGPWGWVVHEGVEWRRPGAGPLAPAVVVDTAGAVRLVPADSVAAVRAAGGVREAFQSYPALLVGEGDVPAPLAAPGRGVDVGHRDARLALGVDRDGRVLVALTRFAGLGGALDAVPFGPTVPEMAALMGALGARRAVLLDGGISAQLLVREPAAAGGRPRTHAWPGLRPVPLGLVAVPR
jgi:hypothetical protein